MDIERREQHTTTTKVPPPSAFSHPLPPPPPPPPPSSRYSDQGQQSHQYYHYAQHQHQQQQMPTLPNSPPPPLLNTEFSRNHSRPQPQHLHVSTAAPAASLGRMQFLTPPSIVSETSLKARNNVIHATTNREDCGGGGGGGGDDTSSSSNLNHFTISFSTGMTTTPTTLASGSNTQNTSSFIINSNSQYYYNQHHSSSSMIAVAFLLLPPLLLLFLHEMSSSFPLLVFLACGLVVYSFDLANLGYGGGIGGGVSNRSFQQQQQLQQQSADGPSSTSSQGRRGGGGGGGLYTLVAIWCSWMLLSLVVGYDVIFLRDDNGEGRRRKWLVADAGFDDKINDYDKDGLAEQIIPSSSHVANDSGIDIVAFTLILTRLGVSILLLFYTAAWTTLQFRWLYFTMPMMVSFLERILYSTLPLVSAAVMAASCYRLSLSSTTVSSIGLDTMATVVPYVFAFHLTLGIWLVVSSASSSSVSEEGRDSPSTMRQQHQYRQRDSDFSSKYDKSGSKLSFQECAIHPREGRILSCLLVFLPPVIHIITFRLRMAGYSSYASWDDFFDFILVSTVPYTLHYLLMVVASNATAIDERWRRSLPWFLKAGTSPAEGRTLRGASVPMAISLLGCISFQHRFLVPLCARASYIINGHWGVVSSMVATTFLTLGTVFAYISIWFLGRMNNNDEYLLGEYHEDFFQLLVAVSATCYGLSCGPKWTFLPIPMLLAESLALWVLTKQLRYAFLTAFVCFTVASILVAYRLTFLNESVEILPGKAIILKKFANLAICASIWLILLVGLFLRAPGGYGSKLMRKYDMAGIFLVVYCIALVMMEFSLLPEPMPLYSRDNFEVGRVAVYTPRITYFTGFLTLIIIWHVKAQHLISIGSTIISSSIVVGKVFAVIIESNYDASISLGMLYRRWAAASLLLIMICCPSSLKSTHIKSQSYSSKRKAAKGKPGSMRNLPRYASLTAVVYCAILLPCVIVTSVNLVLGPLVGILTGRNSGASLKLSEIIGYSASLWGASVLSTINHFLPDGGAELWRRVSALSFVIGMFVSFAAPAFLVTSPSLDISDAFLSQSNLNVEDDATTGGWGLVCSFLAILLAMLGPLELREIRDASGRRDTRQLLRLMIFGLTFGCGISWFITLQSMSKDIFIPIFVTTFSSMAISSMGTVATVMGYFLDASEFAEVEQLANLWAGLAFPVFFVISSISLSAHAHPFGIGGWASTYLSVCGLVSGAFCIAVRMRCDKTSITRGYGNMGCVMAWICSIIVVYGRYGVAGVGVVGTTSVAGIPASVLGTLFCSPILLLLEGEGISGVGRKKYQASSTKSKTKGLVLTNLTRSNWFAPLLAGTVAAFLVSSGYAIFLRGCGLSKFSFLFDGGDLSKSQDFSLSLLHGPAGRTTGIKALDDVAILAKKSVVHTRTMDAAVKLGDSGIWTSSIILGPLMHAMGLVIILPSLQNLLTHSCFGIAPSVRRVLLTLPLNVMAIAIGQGIPSLLALAAIGFMGGMIQWTIVAKVGRLR